MTTDPRPDGLLEECGRIASRLGLALAWSDGIEGAGAKAGSRGGSANWKNAKLVSSDPETAAAFFLTRARKRNPAVVASRSGLVLIESDDAGLDELVARHRLEPLLDTTRVRSARGEHAYYRAPDGYSGPRKLQLAPAGVTVSTDGYLIGAAGLHPSGHVYAYMGSPNGTAVVPAGWLACAVELGEQNGQRIRTRLEADEPIPKGQRTDTLKLLALRLIREGADYDQVLAASLELNAARCRPPLDEKLVERNVTGLFRWAARHPTDTERARSSRAASRPRPRRRARSIRCYGGRCVRSTSCRSPG